MAAGVHRGARASERGSPDQRRVDLGVNLPDVPSAVANATPAGQSGNLVVPASPILRGSDGNNLSGKVGPDSIAAEVTAAAGRYPLQLLADLKAEIGDLGRVERIARLASFMNCTADLTAHPESITATSDLPDAVFGESGRHARASVWSWPCPLARRSSSS
ncbi:MAG: RidA family protein [Opitutaceae bacterium]